MIRMAATLLAGTSLALASACDEGAAPTPRPLTDEPGAALPGAPAGTAASPRAPAAGDPRLVLFDLQTALESVRQTSDAYPTVAEFTLSETWAVQRRALDATFDEWTYTAGGDGYRLVGVRGGREFAIASPGS